MTINTRPEWASTLIDLLEQQRGIYIHLHELCSLQSQHVADGDPEPLLALLGKRQRLIDELTRLNACVAPYKKNWNTLWSQLQSDDQNVIDALIDQVQALMEEIVAQDEKDRQALSEQRDEVGTQLQNIHTGNALNKAYGPKPAAHGVDPRYTDQQG
ncbi:MAG: flagellar export chaperone FlgN [Planctomycetota bacterium]|jgi:hypothetical protein